ncbi:putative lipid scramblase CLPTM1 [Bolinopsis microptera]|uniref:putative lipid scramblase CLPTM1 n=1 Tax=Bolinopsis microptera TaxID=2820187 RepID=UPI00307A85B0
MPVPATVEPAAAVAPVGGAVAAEGQQPEQQNTWKSMLWRFISMYIMISVIPSFFRGKSPVATPDGVAAPGQASNMWPSGTPFELYVYTSTEDSFNLMNSSLLCHFAALKMGEWYDGEEKNGQRNFQAIIPASVDLQNNGTMYLHLVAARNEAQINPLHPKHNKHDVVVTSRMWTRFKKRKIESTTNLLTGETKNKIEGAEDGDIISYWHPNLTISMLDDQRVWPAGQPIPPPFDKWIDIDMEVMQYKPVLYINDYWDLNSDLVPINDTVKELELNVNYAPISVFYFQIYEAQKMQKQWNSMLGVAEASDEENDIVKRTMLETNPYLLGVTIVVSLVHTVFEFLAFKNDIQFWKSRKSLEGLSVRSIIFNIFTQLIVVLYVLDNDTNTMVAISVCIGLVIEGWKITKVMDVSVDMSNPVLGIIPRVTIKDKSSYAESPTKAYDRLAFKYLSWVLTPLLIGYAVYSLLYEEHKGWYSWTLSMCYGYLLLFGFIMMTPQLFINYKMKSVAHLPWRMLTYKALNTFIDDLFAFVIKMPTLYRLGCFRDDIVFFIYLYQRWAYREDPNRVNEFGTSKSHPEGVPEQADITSEGKVILAADEGEEVAAEPKTVEEKKTE